MTNQGGVQQAVRDITGTALDYNGDWSALFDLDGIPTGDWNGRLLNWINQTLGASYTSLPAAMQAFAVEQGFRNWSSMNTFEVFSPTDLDGLVALYDISDLSSLFVERTGASATTPASVDGVVGTVLDLSGNGRHLTAPSDAARAILRQSGNLLYLAFDGVDDRYTAAAPGDLSGASLGAVAQPSVGADGVIFGVQKTLSERFQFSTVAGVNVAAVQNADSGGFQRVDYAENSGEAKTVSFQGWDGSSLTTYTNGVQANTRNVGGTIAVSGGSVYLGALPDNDFHFEGDFHVGGIYSRALDITEQQLFELWLAGRGEVSL